MLLKRLFRKLGLLPTVLEWNNITCFTHNSSQQSSKFCSTWTKPSCRELQETSSHWTMKTMKIIPFWPQRKSQFYKNSTLQAGQPHVPYECPNLEAVMVSLNHDISLEPQLFQPLFLWPSNIYTKLSDFSIGQADEKVTKHNLVHRFSRGGRQKEKILVLALNHVNWSPKPYLT